MDKHLPLGFAAVFSVFLLAGCVAGPDYAPPSATLPNAFTEAKTEANANTTTFPWWNAFDDKLLNIYIKQGMSQNLDIKQAMERVTAASEGVGVAGAGGLPSLIASSSSTVSGSRSISSQISESHTTTTESSLQASWLLDFFGLYRRSKESALAELDAAQASTEVARIGFISQLAAAYIDVRYYQERLTISRKNLASRRKTLDLTKVQLDAGMASRLDLAQAQGLVNSSLAEIPGLETNFLTSAHRVATLLGLPAAEQVATLEKPARQPTGKFRLQTGIPADLLRNRPDIRVAERQLAASVASIGVAEAQLYPSLTLGGTISPRYDMIAGALDVKALSWSFGPQINIPILDGGRLSGNVKISESRARSGYIVWKQTVLSAVEQVENALAAVTRDHRTVVALRAAVHSYETTLDLATTSYQDGASSLLDVLDAQRQVATAQSDLATAVRQTAQDYVALNIAIGGGYAFDDQK